MLEFIKDIKIKVTQLKPPNPKALHNLVSLLSTICYLLQLRRPFNDFWCYLSTKGLGKEISQLLRRFL